MSNGNQHFDMSSEDQLTLMIRQEHECRNVFEDVVAEEYVFQFVGSTKAHTTTARSVTAKAYATQCLGDASESTIQQISKDRSGITAKKQPSQHRQQTKPFDGPGRTVAQ
ncbi:hypothetical protein N7501_003835 [Penicillium viridicatum]|nr:hypothetical protein N7501_003835 [Penicillium viridicatum]